MEMRVMTKNEENVKQKKETKNKSNHQMGCHKLYGKLRICKQYHNVNFITPPIDNKDFPFTAEEKKEIKIQKDRIDVINEGDKYEEDDNDNFEQFNHKNKCDDIEKEYTEKCGELASVAATLNELKKQKNVSKEINVKNNPNNPYKSRPRTRRISAIPIRISAIPIRRSATPIRRQSATPIRRQSATPIRRINRITSRKSATPIRRRSTTPIRRINRITSRKRANI